MYTVVTREKRTISGMYLYRNTCTTVPVHVIFVTELQIQVQEKVD